MAKLGKRQASPAFWQFEAGSLTIDWNGTKDRLSGEGEGAAVVRVNGAAMMAVPRALSGNSGTIRVELAAERVQIGSFSLPCDAVEGSAPETLPTDAAPRHVLGVAFLKTSGELETEGLTEEVAELLERLGRSVAHAAQTFKWLGIEGDPLDRLHPISAPGPAARIFSRLSG
jgi:hypothetical protein